MFSSAQEKSDLLLGDWIRFQYQKCDSSNREIFEFPNQFEFSFEKSSVNVRYNLDYPHYTTYQYYLIHDTINIIEHSKYEIVSINKSYLQLRQGKGEKCDVHSFQKKDEVLDQFKKLMDYEIFNKDTFYISNMALYPQYTGVDIIYDVVEKKFGKKLSKAGINNMEIFIYITRLSEVVHIDINGCTDSKIKDSIIKFLMKANRQWRMPTAYKEPLNQVRVINYSE